MATVTQKIRPFSAAVRADLEKFPSQRQEILRVAGRAGGSSAAGANTPVSAIDMDKKIGPHQTVDYPWREPPPK
jgi:hypothetical protein